MGHAGTLDPFATGLLLVLVGAATRLSQILTGLPKRYAGTIRLGLTTDTDDATGAPRAASGAWRDVTDADIGGAMRQLSGTRQQVPPAFSAKHVEGERAHRRARRGEALTLQPVAVQIQRFTLLERLDQDVRFEADVSSGTYIRSLARELGEHLGCGAHLTALRRLTIGSFDVADAVPLGATPDAVRAGLRPPREAVRHLPAIAIGQAARDAVRHGRAVPTDRSATGRVALVDADDGALLAVADASDGQAQPRVVLVT